MRVGDSEFGGVELAHNLEGRTITTVDTSDGWVELRLDSGAQLFIAPPWGFGLSLQWRTPREPA